MALVGAVAGLAEEHEAPAGRDRGDHAGQSGHPVRIVGEVDQTVTPASPTKVARPGLSSASRAEGAERPPHRGHRHAQQAAAPHRGERVGQVVPGGAAERHGDVRRRRDRRSRLTVAQDQRIVLQERGAAARRQMRRHVRARGLEREPDEGNVERRAAGSEQWVVGVQHGGSPGLSGRVTSSFTSANASTSWTPNSPR